MLTKKKKLNENPESTGIQYSEPHETIVETSKTQKIATFDCNSFFEFSILTVVYRLYCCLRFILFLDILYLLLHCDMVKIFIHFTCK